MTLYSVPDDPDDLQFETWEAAIARAWELTPPGGRRPEPFRWASPEPDAEPYRPLLIHPSSPEVVPTGRRRFTWTGYVATDLTLAERESTARKQLDRMARVEGFQPLSTTFIHRTKIMEGSDLAQIYARVDALPARPDPDPDFGR
jgi:hypothetical protein